VVNGNKDAHSASAAEKEILIPRDVEVVKKKQNLYYFRVMIKKGFAMKHFKFFYDFVKFFLLIKRKYHLLAHHVYLYTVSKYRLQSWARKRKLKIKMG